MTWTDDTSSSTPSWGTLGSDSVTWTETSNTSALGNVMRFVDADGLTDAFGGVDFNNTFSSENPWAFVATQNTMIFGTGREEP